MALQTNQDTAAGRSLRNIRQALQEASPEDIRRDMTDQENGLSSQGAFRGQAGLSTALAGFGLQIQKEPFGSFNDYKLSLSI
jgi:hypothetical protein